MKTRIALRFLLLVCLLLAVVMPAQADVWLPSGLVVIENQAFMDATWLSGRCAIPSGVTSIGSQAFANCSGLTELVIPDSVKSIGSKAFAGCTGLSGTIVLDEDVKVADDAFAGCANLTVKVNKSYDPADYFQWSESGSKVTITGFVGGKDVTSVTVPAEINGKPVTAIGEYAFTSINNLTSVSLPGSVTTIGDHAFSYCSNLKSLSVPTGVTSIGRYAFYYCESLSGTIQLINADVPSNAFTGCKNLTALNYTTNSDGTLTLSRCYVSLDNVKVPSTVAGKRVTAIGREAFSFFNTLKSVSIPEGVTSIGASAFYYCSALESITLPQGVTSIGASAFYNCTSLRSASIPQSVTSIGSQAFYNCSQLSGTMYFFDATVNTSAFGNCGDMHIMCFKSNSGSTLTLDSCRSNASSITVPATVNGRNVVAMAPQAFTYSPNMTSVKLPDAFTSLPNEAFYECTALQSISIPGSVTSIGDYAFYGCSSLKNITIPANVKKVGVQAFRGCKAMDSLKVTSGSTVLSAYAFANCTSLSTVSLPSGFANIGNMTFSNTPWLKAQVAAKAKSITSGCNNSYEKVKAIHDWIIYNSAYDTSYTYYSPEGILFHGKGVCNAYALTFNMMCEAVGVQSVTVAGTATDRNSGTTGSHAWNLVNLNGKWYHVDTTWDDPLPNNRERNTYFLLTDSQLAQDHTWNTANYPASSSSVYASK